MLSSSVSLQRSAPRMQLPRPCWRLLLLMLTLLIAIGLYLTWDMKASLAFTLKFRGKKLITLLLVGFAIATATLLFQTLSNNRILTPGIMGFDRLYALIQAGFMIVLGVTGFSQFNPYLKWFIEASIMIGGLFLLYKLMFRGTSQSLQFLMLAGIVFGTFCASASELITRMLDPTQFAVMLNSLFASFSAVPAELLQIAYLVILFTAVVLIKYHTHLDVLLLGQHTATSLGVDYRKMTRLLLLLIGILVSLSTALVGPVLFFGLLVVHLAYRLAGSYQHRYLIPFAALLGMLTLIIGEFLLQHLFAFNTRLSIIIEFFGGIFFLLLILRQGKA